MKVERTTIIKRARDDAGLKWKDIGKLFGVSITRVRQIYFNKKKDGFPFQAQKVQS